MCHERLGEFVVALKDHAEALAANPRDPALYNNLAWLYGTAADAQVRDPAKALEHARKAVELSGGNSAEILDTLAMAYFINGRTNEAIEAEGKALQLMPANDRFASHLREYGKGNR
jgi:tetratricopeptide (TPR) repeat protein